MRVNDFTPWTASIDVAARYFPTWLAEHVPYGLESPVVFEANAAYSGDQVHKSRAPTRIRARIIRFYERIRMASPQSQHRWREKNHSVKRQLNVMARAFIHDTLTRLAKVEELRGKGEAVTFAAFVTMALEEHAAFNPEAKRLLDVYREAYKRDRDMYAP